MLINGYKKYRYLILIATLVAVALIVHRTAKESVWENIDKGLIKLRPKYLERPVSANYEDDAYGLALEINRVFKTYQKRTQNSGLAIDSIKIQLMTISGISDTCASLISSSVETDMDSLRSEILECVFRNHK
jgi:hypothetical protein